MRAGEEEDDDEEEEEGEEDEEASSNNSPSPYTLLPFRQLCLFLLLMYLLLAARRAGGLAPFAAQLRAALPNGPRALLRPHLLALQERIKTDVLGAALAYVTFMALWLAACLPCTLLEVMPGVLFPDFATALCVSVAGKNAGNWLSYALATRGPLKGWVRDTMLSRYRVLRAVERMVAKQGFKAVLMVRLVYLPMPLKNYGLAALGVPFGHYAAAAFLSGFPFAVVWTAIGSKLEGDVDADFSGVAAFEEGSAAATWGRPLGGAAAVASFVMVVRYANAAWKDLLAEEEEAEAEMGSGSRRRSARVAR